MLNLVDLEPGRQTSLSEELGEVFTRRWVVELILDLVGYTDDRDLAALKVLEPACGEGAFLGPIIDRLIASCVKHGRRPPQLADALRAFDLSELNVERARKLATIRLIDGGVLAAEAERLTSSWICEGDFLLDDDIEPADFVLGNPPYIRLENVSLARTAAYRAACPTMRGRSDVYVGFIERGLRLLTEGGALGFIVADRWMHNQYGADLRRLVADGFSVETIVEMHDADAFEDEVSAYPAVTVIRRSQQGRAVLAMTGPGFGAVEADRFRSWALRGRTPAIERKGFRAARLDAWFPADELWPSGDPAQLAILSDLEKRFPPLEDAATGTRVGIGVATGADSVYITRDEECVERQRLLPLVKAGDIARGQVNWSGSFLVNPWEGGRLVDMRRYPRMESYMRANERVLRSRHIAQRRPESWHRTIDRVNPDLLQRPKLLLPDIKAVSHPVLEEGNFYPHHNLYFITSDDWDLEVLGGLLLSEIANLFVGAYCVKMRGGCYRFQAQYIRRIRVPTIASIGKRESRMLARSFIARDVDAATAVAAKIYGISPLRPWF
ncbi:MAG: Eco57I restriction-modification methylase domain-containing protein [Acidimicrobiales bacterium]